jgi:OOP family OmpA-OmpF porin
VFFCGVCLAGAQAALADEVQPGFYFGLGAGESSYDIEKFKGRNANWDALFPGSRGSGTRSSTFEDSDTSLALFAGYHFNPYIAVEASYMDLGTAEYQAELIVSFQQPLGTIMIPLAVDVDSTGFTLAALGSLPIGSGFDLHGRLGVLFAETDVSRRIGSQGRDQDTFDSTGALYGIGAGFNFAEHWSLSLDWTRYDNLGDEDDPITEASFEIDALSFSAMYRF